MKLRTELKGLCDINSCVINDHLIILKQNKISDHTKTRDTVLVVDYEKIATNRDDVYNTPSWRDPFFKNFGFEGNG